MKTRARPVWPPCLLPVSTSSVPLGRRFSSRCVLAFALLRRDALIAHAPQRSAPHLEADPLSTAKSRAQGWLAQGKGHEAGWVVAASSGIPRDTSPHVVAPTRHSHQEPRDQADARGVTLIQRPRGPGVAGGGAAEVWV